MDAVDRDIQFEQLLFKQAMIMACMLKQNRGLGEWDVLSDAIYEGPEAFPWLLKRQCWTALEAFVALE